MTRLVRSLVAAVAVVALVAGCSDDDSSSDVEAAGDATASSTVPVAPADGGDSSDTTAATPVATGVLPIATAEIPFGEVLVDGEGFSLYAFTDDEGAATPTCTGECAEKWPPFIVDDLASVQVPEGVTAPLDVVERDDGSSQLTVAGRPMYVMADDEPGLALCQGGEGTWFVVGLDGEPITTLEPVG